MAKQPYEPQVLIPYSQLLELLEASRKLQELARKVDRLEQQQTALRGQFIELMEKLRDID